MALFDFFARFSPRKRRAEKAREELKANAEKALRMKQENGTGTNIPPHQTAHEGMRPNTTNEDHIPAREGYFTPELKANAEKALRMKQESGTGTQIPPHQTAHEGMRDHTSNEDHTPAREGYFEPELKRTKVARSGDAS